MLENVNDHGNSVKNYHLPRFLSFVQQIINCWMINYPVPDCALSWGFIWVTQTHPSGSFESDELFGAIPYLWM